MEQIADRSLPEHMGYEWTGMAYQEKRVGGEAVWIFAMAVLLVYLVLAAQYESWFIPWAVILVVPLGVMGAVAAVSARGMDNNVYTQIGIVLIIALASKNSILIVEFARELRCRGIPLREAAAQAARMRLPSHPDDFLRVHHGSSASDGRARRRCRRAASARHRGLRRDARFHCAGRFLCAGILCRDAGHRRMVGARSPRRA